MSPVSDRTVAGALCRELERLGARHVFGLPGTQNLALFEALRRSSLRTVVPTSELAAAFMANGYFRASGRPGVILCIPGPGFAWSLPGLAEASLDSAAVLCVTGRVIGGAEARPGLQEIDQAGMAAPLVRSRFRIREPSGVAEVLREAYAKTLAGEPGPVLLEVDVPVPAMETPRPADGREGRAGASGGDGSAASAGAGGSARDDDAARAAAERIRDALAGARRVLLYVGQGAQGGAAALRALAERLGAPVVPTTSGRGALPESHPLCLVPDRLPAGWEAANALAERADLVLALGVGFHHNGTGGYRLRLPADRLWRVDTAAPSDRAWPRAAEELVADVPAVLRALERAVPAGRAGDGWPAAELEDACQGPGPTPDLAEPAIRGVRPPTAAAFFAALRRAMPDEARLVTDSGEHQSLARRHFEVRSPRGLLLPADLQSMGYGLPAAIGARLADPVPTVALIGDGGLRMTAMELATAASAGAPLTLIVFTDGALGLIRLQQLAEHGRAYGVTLPGLDLESLCDALGVGYRAVGAGDGHDGVEEELRRAVTARRVEVVEVFLGDTRAIRRSARRRRLKEAARRALGPRLTARLKWWLGTGRAPER